MPIIIEGPVRKIKTVRELHNLLQQLRAQLRSPDETFVQPPIVCDVGDEDLIRCRMVPEDLLQYKAGLTVTDGIKRRQDGQIIRLILTRYENDFYSLFMNRGCELVGITRDEVDFLVKNYIYGKKVLCVPGSVNAFTLGKIGAEVFCVDADESTIDFLKAIRSMFYTNGIGDLILPHPDLSPKESFRLGKTGIERLTACLRENPLRLNPMYNVYHTHAFLGSYQGEGVQSICKAFSDMRFSFITVMFLIGLPYGIETFESAGKAFEDIYNLSDNGTRVLVRPFPHVNGSSKPRGFNPPKQHELITRMKEIIPEDKFAVERVFEIKDSPFYFGLLRVKKG